MISEPRLKGRVSAMPCSIEYRDNSVRQQAPSGGSYRARDQRFRVSPPFGLFAYPSSLVRTFLAPIAFAMTKSPSKTACRSESNRDRLQNREDQWATRPYCFQSQNRMRRHFAWRTQRLAKNKGSKFFFGKKENLKKLLCQLS